MSYVTQATTWLSDGISQDVKTLIARFYELADSKNAGAGGLMATEVFSADGVLISPSGTFRGSEEISKSRVNAWETVTARKHVITKAFSGNDASQELVLLGSVHMEFTNGKELDSAFSCHIKLEPPHPELREPRIRFMEVYPATASAVGASTKK